MARYIVVLEVQGQEHDVQEAEHQHEQQQEAQCVHEDEEVAIVVLANAGADPGTVVVEALDAVVADPAMSRPRWPVNSAYPHTPSAEPYMSDSTSSLSAPPGKSCADSRSAGPTLHCFSQRYLLPYRQLRIFDEPGTLARDHAGVGETGYDLGGKTDNEEENGEREDEPGPVCGKILLYWTAFATYVSRKHSEHRPRHRDEAKCDDHCVV